MPCISNQCQGWRGNYCSVTLWQLRSAGRSADLGLTLIGISGGFRRRDLVFENSERGRESGWSIVKCERPPLSYLMNVPPCCSCAFGVKHGMKTTCNSAAQCNLTTVSHPAWLPLFSHRYNLKIALSFIRFLFHKYIFFPELQVKAVCIVCLCLERKEDLLLYCDRSSAAQLEQKKGQKRYQVNLHKEQSLEPLSTVITFVCLIKTQLVFL